MSVGGNSSGARPAAQPRSVLGGSTTGTSTGTTYYLHPCAVRRADTTLDAYTSVWLPPRAGLLRNLRARNGQQPAAAQTCTLTVRKAGSGDTGLSVAWTDADVAGTLKSDADTVAVATGDQIIMKYVAPAAVTAVDVVWTLEFEPST